MDRESDARQWKAQGELTWPENRECSIKAFLIKVGQDRLFLHTDLFESSHYHN
jgi:hypothetical protein